MSEKVVLSEESKRVLKQCFAHYDKNGNGTIDSSELPEALIFAGICGPQEEIEFIRRNFDTSKDEQIQIDELVDNWHILAQHSVDGDELMEAFAKLDKDKNGYVTTAELKVYLTQAGEKWNLDQFRELLRYLTPYDKNRDGKFSYPEFVEMFRVDMYPFKKPEEYQKTDVTKQYEMVKKE